MIFFNVCYTIILFYILLIQILTTLKCYRKNIICYFPIQNSDDP